MEAARAKAEHANKAAEADIAAKVAARALVMLDPRSPKSARAAADAQLQLARAAAANNQFEGEVAVQAAERDAELMAERFELEEAAVKAFKTVSVDTDHDQEHRAGSASGINDDVGNAVMQGAAA